MVRLRDLARQVGVHPSTVSRVLNGDPDARLSPATRARILALARQTGYRPNRLARSLKTQRTHLLGVLVPDISNPFFAILLRAVERATGVAGYSVILCNTDDDSRHFVQHLRVLGEGHVDGLLVATARRGDPTLALLPTLGLPYVLVNRRGDGEAEPCVVSDDAAGGRLVAEHLVALGHRRIAHIAGPRDASSTATRLAAFRARLDELGVPLAESLVVPGGLTEEAGERGMAALLALPPAERPTAVFAANDLVAVGAMAVARAAGLRLPEELSVVGYNDIPLAARLAPTLTTVRVPLAEMGQRASELLIRMLEPDRGHGDGASQVVLPVELVVRESTGPPASQGT
ncbi:MAG: LacI family DNA-binding transcriptional regulator [Chloroflexi bacterium]|nr:LacI family DNA-binding transcriptional regulator [Chloroflexota bacterium]